jgi:hypothetical protein
MNAISKREAVSLADMRKVSRHLKAVEVLRSIGSEDLAREIENQIIEEPNQTR